MHDLLLNIYVLRFVAPEHGADILLNFDGKTEAIGNSRDSRLFGSKFRGSLFRSIGPAVRQEAEA